VTPKDGLIMRVFLNLLCKRFGVDDIALWDEATKLVNGSWDRILKRQKDRKEIEKQVNEIFSKGRGIPGGT